MTPRRWLLALTGAYVARAVARRTGLTCWARGQHAAVKVLLGWRCSVCGMAGADLQEMGLQEVGYVNPLRSTYSRRHGGEVTRSAWEDIH